MNVPLPSGTSGGVPVTNRNRDMGAGIYTRRNEARNEPEVRKYYETILPFYEREKESVAGSELGFWRGLARASSPHGSWTSAPGLGRITSVLARQAPAVGIDVSVEMLRRADRPLNPRRSRARLVAADMRRVDLAGRVRSHRRGQRSVLASHVDGRPPSGSPERWPPAFGAAGTSSSRGSIVGERSPSLRRGTSGIPAGSCDLREMAARRKTAALAGALPIFRSSLHGRGEGGRGVIPRASVGSTGLPELLRYLRTRDREALGRLRPPSFSGRRKKARGRRRSPPAAAEGRAASPRTAGREVEPVTCSHVDFGLFAPRGTRERFTKRFKPRNPGRIEMARELRRRGSAP